MCANETHEVKVKVDDALLERDQEENSSVTYPGLHNLCKDPDHRKLAICSIICGLSCFGIMSLMYSVKARETRRQNEDSPETQQRVQSYLKKALKWGIASIIAWIFLIFIFPFLVGLVSFFITFID